MMKSVVVTGVSTGIGNAIVTELIEAGWRVFGSVRRPEDAQAAQTRFGRNFAPLIFDVTDEPAVQKAAAIVEKTLEGQNLAGLVNNAGAALADPLLIQSTEDFRRQIDINLAGPFIVTKAFAPLLGAREGASGEPGRIINMSSVGGRLAGPFLGAYVASRHGLEGMSASLRRELQIFGVDVIIVGPGSVATPIWDKSEADMAANSRPGIWAKPFELFIGGIIKEGRKGSKPEDIGRTVVKALSAAKPKARYAPVAGKLQNWNVPTSLPARTVDRLIGKQLGLLRKR